MEEFAYVPPDCFFEVVVPLMMLAQVAFIGITTISGAVDNYVNDLIRKHAYPHMEITMVCAPCRRAGLVANCPHQKHERPKWQSESQLSKVKKIFGEEREDQFARESMGILTAPKTQCFDSDAILNLFSAQRYGLDRSVNYLFVTIDPCGGSMVPENSISDFAVCSHVTPGFKIVGFEGIACSHPKDYEMRLVEHIRLALSHPQIRDAKLICAVEGNLAFEATHLKRKILEFYPNAVFISNMGLKDGVKTDENTKHGMALMLATALNSENVTILNDWVTTDPNPLKLLEKVKKQLLNYKRLTIPPKSPFHPTKFKYSGKGNNTADKDDMSIVVQLALYWSQRFFTTTEFIEHHR
jgi:hypothetical protein